MKDKTLGYILMTPIFLCALGILILYFILSPLGLIFFTIYIIVVLMFLIGLVKITR